MDLVRHGDLGATDQVRREDESEWRMIADVPELADLENEPTSADLDAMLVDEASAHGDDLSSSAHDLDMIQFSEESSTTSKPKVEPRWYCKVLNQELGPFGFDALLEMVHEEEIARDDLVRSDGGGDWQPAETIMGLFTAEQRPKKAVQASGGILSPQRAAMFKAAPKKKEELDWYNRVLGEEFGPVSWKTLQAEVRARKLTAEDEVRVTGSETWQRISEVPELAALLPKKEPAAPTPAAPTPAAPTPAAPAAPSAPPPSYEAPPSAPASSYDSYSPPTPRPSAPPAYSPSRAAAPPPPSRSSRSTPRRSSSGGGGGLDLSGLMSGVKLDPKVIGGIAAVAVLVLLYFTGILSGNDSGHVAKVEEIYVQVTALAQQSADQAAWQGLAQSTEAQRKEHQAELEEIASSKRPALRVLLDVYRYTLPRIFTGTEEERTDAIKIFETQMEAAKRTQ